MSSCRPGAPKAIELGWVQKQLSPTELALWERMSNPDQRHSVAVAQAVTDCLPAAPAWVVAAALLVMKALLYGFARNGARGRD